MRDRGGEREREREREKARKKERKKENERERDIERERAREKERKRERERERERGNWGGRVRRRSSCTSLQAQQQCSSAGARERAPLACSGYRLFNQALM